MNTPVTPNELPDPSSEDVAQPMELLVKRYRSAAAYSRDAPQMSRRGWRLQGQVGQSGHLRIARTIVKGGALGCLFLPLGLLAAFMPSRTSDKVVVTWARDAVAAQRAHQAEAEERQRTRELGNMLIVLLPCWL